MQNKLIVSTAVACFVAAAGFTAAQATEVKSEPVTIAQANSPGVGQSGENNTRTPGGGTNGQIPANGTTDDTVTGRAAAVTGPGNGQAGENNTRTPGGGTNGQINGN